MSLYNVYVKCIESCVPGLLTNGKIYKICNGVLTLNTGVTLPNQIEKFIQLQQSAVANWEELELVKCDAYKIGDCVLVQNKRGIAWNIDGKMDSYIGKICVISEKINENTYNLNHDKWYFNGDDFVGKLVPKAVLNKYP